jgi:hypothetical protein
MAEFGKRGRGDMVKRLCVGIAAATYLATPLAAGAADLSMTPIYKSRPSVVSTLNGSLKSEYQTVHIPAFSRADNTVGPPPGAAGKTGVPANDQVSRASGNDR